ncbi:hypothetical protein FOC1_h10016917, partial [Fusarium oxysporum f. sp. cubense race 1]
MPCIYCFKNKKEYYFNDIKKSSRCLKCIRQGHSCDSVYIISTYIYISLFLLVVC